VVRRKGREQKKNREEKAKKFVKEKRAGGQGKRRRKTG